MMQRRDDGLAAAKPGGMSAEPMTEETVNCRLIQHDPMADPIAESASKKGGEFGKPMHAVAVQPSAFVLQSLGQIPVIQAEPRRDLGLGELVDQAIVKIQAGAIHGPYAFRQDTGPGNREAVRVHACPLQQANILSSAMIVVTRDPCRFGVRDGTWPRHEFIPDARAPSIFAHRALDLIGRSGRTPDESFPKVEGGQLGGPSDCRRAKAENREEAGSIADQLASREMPYSAHQ